MDYSWNAGGGNSRVMIATGGMVTFWTGSCTFNTPGTYTFHCDLHTFVSR
jgi:hypothetical protein